MDDYEKTRILDRIGYEVESLNNHRKECDADMDAHGKMLLQNDYRTTNVEKSVERLVIAVEKYISANDKSVGDLRSDVGTLKEFQLRINTTWKVTASISATVGAVIGFALKVLWGKS